MIEAALVVVLPRYPGGFEQFGDARRHLRRARRRKLDLVGARRKPVIIVEKCWRRIVLDGDDRLFPMAGDDHQCLRRRGAGLLRHVAQIVSHAAPLSIGLNCALGAKEMRAHIAELGRVADTLICAYPNAGLPNEFGHYDESPAMVGC